jgi:ribosome-binding factor A
MPKEFHRSRRVEEQIQRLLAELLRREVKDPRVGSVTITAVEVSRDLSHAKVFFLPFDTARPVEQVSAALASASGFLRLHLRKLLKMRQAPELHFVLDETIDKAAHLSSLINAAVASDVARHVDDPEPAEPAESAATPEKPAP